MLEIYYKLKLKTMKKFLMLLVVSIFFLTQLVAQKPSFTKGDNVVNLGVGLGSTLYSRLKYKSLIPPISLSYELGIIKNIFEKGVIGVGGYLGYSLNNSEDFRCSNLVIGGRASFHYPLVDNLDTYSGIILAYNISSQKWAGTGTEPVIHPSPLVFVPAWFVGGRYYFNEAFAVMAEVGYGITYMNLGFAFKF
jgi:hypothetical protein